MGWHVVFIAMLNRRWFVIEGFVNGTTREFDSLMKIERGGDEDRSLAMATTMAEVYGATLLLVRPNITNRTWRTMMDLAKSIPEETETHYFTAPDCLGYCKRCDRNSLSCECC